MVGVIVVTNLYMYFEMQNEKLMKFVDWRLNLVETRLEFRSRFFILRFYRPVLSYAVKLNILLILGIFSTIS